MNSPTPGYNQTIPAEIMTPDLVDTRIGRLEFFDGFPTDTTTRTVFDHLDFLRGVQVFLDFIPAASLEAVRRGVAAVGVTSPHQIVIFDELMDSNPLFLTGNTDTVYAIGFLDLATDGPTVVEIPPGCGPGTVDDAFFRFVIDMGLPGPDRGQGGKYLIVPADYTGGVPDGYFVGRSPSRINLLILRGLLVDGRPEAPTRTFKEGLRVYPLAAADNPPVMEFVSGSGKSFNTVHANTAEFFNEVAEVIQREPVDLIDPELRGLASAIGLRKGRDFDPDPRMRDILEDAAAVGNATARALAYRTRDPEAYLYPERWWKAGFIGGDYRWLIDDGAGGRNLDSRSTFFYQATVNTPAMALRMPGRGSQYGLLNQDKTGAVLDGGSAYRLRIPTDVPAKDFWSVVVYDPQTRSELQTSQPYPSKNSRRDTLTTNPDGSIDLLFGPTAPSGGEANWTQTVPGKGWFLILRLYGPLEPWFEQTWRPGDLELID